MAKNLTEKQEAFLDALFGPANGDYSRAARLAGYSDSVKGSVVARSLKDEIFERTKEYIAINGPRAAHTMVSVLTEDFVPSAKEKMTASKDILDRAGFKPKDQVEVEGASPVFILPAKDGNTEDN